MIKLLLENLYQKKKILKKDGQILLPLLSIVVFIFAIGGKTSAVQVTAEVMDSAMEQEQPSASDSDSVIEQPPSSEPEQTMLPIPSPPENGLVQVGKHYQYFKNGKPVKSRWKTIDGYKYYFKANGNAAVKSCKIHGTYYVFNVKGRLFTPKKDSLVTVEDVKFYVTPKGIPIPGWKIIKKKLYYVYKNGRCAANETIDKIKFTEDGYAKSDSISSLKIKTMQVTAKIIKPDMNKAQKLKTCWYYINSFRFKARSYPDETKKNWKYQCALDMLNEKSGNCYGISHAFAALAKEIGYKPYVIVIPKIHCWVRINGKYWDNMGNRMGVPKPNRKFKKNQISKF